MIEDLLGNIGSHQEQLKQKLDAFDITESSRNGELSVTITAAKRIKDLRIDPARLDLSDHEQLEDLLLITLNQAMEKADAVAAEETRKLVNNMLPPGFANMFG